MTTYTPTIMFENPNFIKEFKILMENMGAKLVSEKIENEEYKPRSKEEILNTFENICKDIKSGNIYNKIVSEEDFYNELEKC